MARRKPIDTLLAPRVAALSGALSAALTGDPTAVHEARVASRRLREVLPVLETSDERAWRGARKAVRRVTRAFGRVRELDVAVGHFDEMVAAHTIGPAAQATARRALRADRAAAMRKARAALPPARVVRMMACIEALGERAASADPDAVASATAARVLRGARRVQKALDRVGAVYVPGRLHAVRIAVKRLRYALEVRGAVRAARVSAQLSQLRVIQDLLGRAHDLHVLAEYLREVQLRVVGRSRATARELGDAARVLDRECRRLHAAFMSRRGGLLALSASLSAGSPAPRARSAA